MATLAATSGAAALTAAGVKPGVPLLPMLAQIAEDFDEVLEAHGGTTALEYKYDGARIQLHREDDRVSIWTRRLSDVCLLYTSPSPRDRQKSRMPSSA